jgi:radical SAM family RiPP maturation amino acid epimerase
MKRFGEWYVASAEFRSSAAEDPGATAARYGLDLDDAEAQALLRRDLMTEWADLEGVPDRVLAFRESRRDIFLYSSRWRRVGTGADPRFHAWRQREIERCEVEFGMLTSGQIMQAPAAVELQQGCSVGCWFCGVSAPALDGILRYTPDVAELWTDVTGALRERCGAALASGLLYWATDPLDNPDYERFLDDWVAAVGSVPQTTTAQPLKHLERVRALIARSAELDVGRVRISVLSLPVLRRLFEAFTPEDLADTELVMQMPEAGTHIARAGRAAETLRAQATLRPKRDTHRIEGDEASANTIACVSGFLVNMVGRSVRMISPCHASEEWPNGYRVLGEGDWVDGADFRRVLDRLIEDHASPIPGHGRLRFRPQLRYQVAFDGFDLQARFHRLRFRSRPGLVTIADAVVGNRAPSLDDVVVRCTAKGVPAEQARATIDMLDSYAVFDESARPPLVPTVDSVRPAVERPVA